MIKACLTSVNNLVKLKHNLRDRGSYFQEKASLRTDAIPKLAPDPVAAPIDKIKDV